MPEPTYIQTGPSTVENATPILIGAENTVIGVPIQATTITETKNIVSFKVYVVGIELFTSVTLSVTLYDENSNAVGNRSFVVEGAEYLAWNNDDQYLIDLVAQKLGFTLSA
jgi:hypothetical protein